MKPEKWIEVASVRTLGNPQAKQPAAKVAQAVPLTPVNLLAIQKKSAVMAPPVYRPAQSTVTPPAVYRPNVPVPPRHERASGHAANACCNAQAVHLQPRIQLKSTVAVPPVPPSFLRGAQVGNGLAPQNRVQPNMHPAPVQAKPLAAVRGVPCPAKVLVNPYAAAPHQAPRIMLRVSGMSHSSVLQPAFDPKWTTSVPNLDAVAKELSQSHGYKETATFAVVNQEDAGYSIYGQRYYENTFNAVPGILGGHGIGLGVDYVTPDASEEYVHAEMLAVSEWLAGNKDKPEMIGASRDVCAYCAIVLKYLGITIFSQPSPDPTPNWANPWHLNGMPTPLPLQGRIPLKYRKKSINYD